MDSKKTTNQFDGLIKQADVAIEPIFLTKLPQLAPNIQEILAKITPYFTVIGVVFSVIAIISLLGVYLFASPIFLMYGGMGTAQAYSTGIVSAVFLIVQVILEALAIPGLFKRQRSAWNLLFAAIVVGIVENVLSLNIIGALLSFLISFYMLYQIKALYNK